MKTENWILSFGAGILFAVVVVAIFPDDLWDDDMHYSSHVMGSAMGGAPGVASGLQYAAPPAVPPAALPQPAFSQPPQGQNVVMPTGRGMVPFTAARTEAFAGTVTRVQGSGTDQGWGQIHVWIAQNNGAQRELSLAPDWYLDYLGCGVTGNMYLQGVGFVFSDANAGDGLLYAREVTVNGVKCRLRNDEGFALWSNRLR